MKLLDICEISGKSIKKFDGIKKYIATGDIINNKIVGYSSVTYDNKPSRANVEISENEVIFAKMISTKKVMLSNSENMNNIYSTGFCCLKPKDDIDIDYLYYYLNSNSFNVQKDKNCSGATQKAITNEGLSKIEIRDVPTLDEQKKAAKKFKTTDLLISIKKEEIEKYSKLIKSKFIEMFGNIKTNDKSWDVYDTIGNNCILNPGKSELNDLGNIEVSFVPMQSVSEDGYIDTSDIKLLNDVKKGFTYFKENDILFAKITPCMENGKGAVASGLKNNIGFGSTEFHVIRPSDKINSIWLYTYTTFKNFRNEAEKKMTGSAGQKRVPVSFIESYKIAIPPVELQNKFAAIVKKIIEQKKECEKSLKKLEEMQSALMQEYFG